MAENAPGNVYNIACGGQYTLNTLLDELRRIIGVHTEARYEAPRPGDILHSFADISRAEKDLGYRPKIDFKEGLKKTVAWFASFKNSNTPVGGIKIG
jgi:nucleoside-diphosphate-sugar epimerase